MLWGALRQDPTLLRHQLTCENKADMAKILGVEEFATLSDDVDEDVTANRRMDGALQETGPAHREAILYEVLDADCGLGHASRTAIPSTASEVVGITGYAKSSWYSEQSKLQNSKTGSDVTGSRALGNATCGIAAKTCNHVGLRVAATHSCSSVAIVALFLPITMVMGCLSLARSSAIPFGRSWITTLIL